MFWWYDEDERTGPSKRACADIGIANTRAWRILHCLVNREPTERWAGEGGEVHARGDNPTTMVWDGEIIGGEIECVK